jgi:tetratricopeptide (TPR) repeat protein
MSYSFGQFDSHSDRLAAQQRRKRLWIIVGVVAVVLGILYAEYHISTHRTLHVVNGYDRPVTVRLESGGAVDVPPHSFRTLSVSEGSHQATVVGTDGMPDRTTDFTITSNFAARLIKDPVFVLNVDGAAVVVYEKAIYREKPVNDDAEAEYKFHVGQPYVAFDDVDYVFKELPKELRVEGKKATKTRVGFETHDPAGVMFGAPDEVTADDRLKFVEAHIQMNPDDEDLMGKYLAYAALTDQSARTMKFFQSGLERRPVRIQWHRAYQAVRSGAGQEAELAAEYRKRVEAEPKNSDWLYLLGRVESDQKTAESLFDRAIAANPKSPYPWFAKSYALRTRGDFTEATKAAAEAHRLAPKDERITDAYYVSRLGAGQVAALVGEVEQEWHANANTEHVFSPSKLWEVLTVQGNTSRMGEVLEAYRTRVFAASSVTDKARAMLDAELEMNFLRSRYDQVRAQAGALPEDDRAEWLFRANLAMGNTAEAEKYLEDDVDFPYGKLALSVVLRRKQETKRADELQAEVVKVWEEGSGDDRRRAALMKKIPNVAAADAEIVETSEPYEAALVLTALAQQCPKDRATLLDRAEKRNFRPLPYQTLIRDTIADARKLKS